MIRAKAQMLLSCIVLSLLFFGGFTAHPQRPEPQPTTASDWAFSVKPDQVAHSDITARNICFKRHRFRIELQNLPFMTLLGPATFQVNSGSEFKDPVKIDATGLKPGDYEGTAIVICETCPKEKGCTQDRQNLRVRMTVLPSTPTPAPRPSELPPGQPERQTSSGDDACDLWREWRKGPAIKLIKPIDYWPKGDQLKQMRPGDVIAITLLAKDQDYLVQTCRDCSSSRGEVTKKWGPYADKVFYSWHLDHNKPGRLIEPNVSEANTVLYQIPLCWGPGRRETQIARLFVSVGNDTYPSDSNKDKVTAKTNARTDKALDDKAVGQITFVMQKDVAGALPGWIEVEVLVDQPGTNVDENIPESKNGTCVPQTPQWLTDFPITVKAQPTQTDAPDLCPNYLTLLSAEATDGDAAELECVNDESCRPTHRALHTLDNVEYEWALKLGKKGSFPLGTTGPVVAFLRSRSENVEVECLVKDSGTQIKDTSPLLELTKVFAAKKPKAFVAMGDDSDTFGNKVIDLQRAADEAEKKYKEAGYDVERNDSATINDLENVLKTPCYQAIWITGHGAIGTIFMKQPPQNNVFSPAGLSVSSFSTWRCMQDPFVRELVLLGCNTFNPAWPRYLVRGRVYDFGEKLYANLGGQIVGRNPYIWEKDRHSPAAAHNLAGP